MSAHTYLPTIADAAALFEDECRARGASAVDCYQDDRRLIARAVIGPAREVGRGDAINGGVALRIEGPEMVVHPYTWRQVCSNGAIAARILGTHRIERVEVDAAVVSAAFVGPSLEELRSAIEICASHERLEESVGLMRSASTIDGALAVSILSHLLQARTEAQRDFLLSVLDRQRAANDPSAYGLFNAVTSAARDTADPERRWQLERIGGRLLERVVTVAMTTPAPREALECV